MNRLELEEKQLKQLEERLKSKKAMFEKKRKKLETTQALAIGQFFLEMQADKRDKYLTLAGFSAYKETLSNRQKEALDSLKND